MPRLTQVKGSDSKVKALESRVKALEAENKRLTSARQAVAALATRHKSAPVRQKRVRARFLDWLNKHNVRRRAVLLEVGGRGNCFREENTFKKYINLDIARSGGPDCIVGDITRRNAAVPDGHVSCVYSHDVFEHLNQPFDAAKEIHRMLAPGGVTFVDTLFAWRRHGVPNDYFRYTTDGLRSVFESAGFVTLETEYDMVERRRDLANSAANRVQPDALGGFRENIRVRGLFRKPL